tara:strand:- start:27702 stop:28658 length:957 start_codon:yes stop_codon:yes gene_type:complete
MSEGLFSDLEEIPHEDIQDRVKSLENQLRSLDNEFNELKKERRSQIDLVKSLREAVGGIEEANSERRNLLKKFHEIKKVADKERSARDKVNEAIPPPASVLEEWMSETYTKLTTIDNDLTAVPTLNRELDTFQRFFELQSAVVVKRTAEESHARYIKLVEEMRTITSQLDNTRKIKNKVAEKTSEENSELDTDKVTRKEIRKMSRRISGIDKKLDVINTERKEGRKEINKLRSYLRITSSRGKPIKLSDVKQRASEGGSLNAQELGAILDSGGLANIDEKKTNESVRTSRRMKGKKKTRRLGVTRGAPRKGNSATKRE